MRSSYYFATIGGDIHNYQHYVATREGRTIDYIVSGAAGAFMHATHRIGALDPKTLHGCDEERFRSFPLRGDSLAIYSRVISRTLKLGDLLTIPRGDAGRIMAKRLAVDASSEEGREATPGLRSRFKALFVRHIGGRLVQRFLSEIFDWDEPPLFKSFLRIDATAQDVRIRCIAATGCAEAETNPPVVDDFTIRFDSPDRRPAPG